MPSTKTPKASAKWPDAVFEEFISSGMKLHDLLDEDLQATDYSWHQMRRLCEHYNVTTGGTKEAMANRLRDARDDAIVALTSSDADEEIQQLASAKQQVQQSDDEEAAATDDAAPLVAAGNTSTTTAHQQEIIDLDAKIDQLKREFTRDLDEKLDLIKSPASRGAVKYIGFYNRKQDLRSWCQDGHPDENRFRTNGWNPVWSADTKEDILRWVMDKNSTSSLSNQQSNDNGDSVENTKTNMRSTDGTSNDQGKQALDETPKNQGISNKLQDRTKHGGGNQSKSAWGNAMAKLQETARQLGIWRLPGKTPPVEV